MNTPRIEVVAIDCLMVRLFEVIAEANMPWMLAASERLRAGFADRLIDLVPSYTTLMIHYDLTQLSPAQARELIAEALADLQPNATTSGQCHILPVWYDLSVGPELRLLSQRSGWSVSEVIRHHSEREYQVFALGFAPGFAFMGLVEDHWRRHGSILRASRSRRVASVLPSARRQPTRSRRRAAGT